ncbi:luxQ [Symbiodinium natans]|uniref:LuxQ protein n=1 Tax=Symbiodinium natans TaxID=878477 RepID=A0A812RAW9_9DINO|nr:luxQ [Symbiodinium natans]
MQPRKEPGPPLELLPWTAVACAACAVFSAGLLTAAYRDGGISEAWPSGEDTAAVRHHAASAVMLVFSAFVLEIGFLLTGVLFGRTNDQDLSGRMGNYRVMDSLLTLFEYSLKLAGGICIWKLDGFVHTDLWAVGGPRPVYFLRFLQWSIAVPVLILISNRAFLAQLGFRATLLRSLPSLVAVFLSVWLSWVMEVTTVYAWRWPCMFVSGFCFVVAEVDQLCDRATFGVQSCAVESHGHPERAQADESVLEQSDHRQCRHVELYGLKRCMVVYQRLRLLCFSFYTGVFMLGRFGLIGLQQEQYIYAYCDSTVKVLQGAILALIRGCEDAKTIHVWYAEAVAYKKDFDAILKLAHVPIFTMRTDLYFPAKNW